MVEEHGVKLVVMDYILEDMYGVKVAEALKKIDENLQIIFLTGYYPCFDAVDELKLDVYKVFFKPVKVEELLSEIRSIFSEDYISHQVSIPYSNIVLG